MNTSVTQGEWNLLKTSADAAASLTSRAWSMRALATKAGQQARKVSRNAAAIFLSRQPASSLRVAWAGVLRAECDRLVPEPNEELRFRVANEMFLCEEGKPLVFDDSWNPEAWDQMNGYRVVFQTTADRKIARPMGRRLQQFLARFGRS